MVCDDFRSLLEKHDKEFNRDHKMASGPAAGGNETKQQLQSPKKLQKSYDDVATFHANRSTCVVQL